MRRAPLVPVTAAHRGKAIIIGMLSLALAATAFGIWYLRGLSQRSLGYWGPEVSDLISRAPQVEVMQLPDGLWEDISQARGLINLRRALVADASYDWEATSAQPLRWHYALRFRDDGREAVLVFSLDSGQVMLKDRPPSVSARPILRGLKSFFAEHFPR